MKISNLPLPIYKAAIAFGLLTSKIKFNENGFEAKGDNLKIKINDTIFDASTKNVKVTIDEDKGINITNTKKE